MRSRKALVVSLFIAAFFAANITAVSSAAPNHREDPWAFTHRQMMQLTAFKAPQLTTASLAPLGKYFAKAIESEGPSYSPSTTSPAPLPSSTPTVSTPPPVVTTAALDVSGTDLLLADAPAYVIAAFHCIAYEHESGGDPTAVNPYSGDSGLYQFATGTWLAHGGGQFASRAMYATVAEQDTVAYWTWEADGFSPWDGDNECWSG